MDKELDEAEFIWKSIELAERDNVFSWAILVSFALLSTIMFGSMLALFLFCVAYLVFHDALRRYDFFVGRVNAPFADV